MMKKTTKIGVLFLTGEWFGVIGTNRGFFSGLPQILKEDALNIKKILPTDVEVIDPGIVNSRGKSAEAVHLFKKEKVDAILICYLTWGEDWLFLDVIEKLPEIPLFLWSYVPSSKLPSSFDMVQLFRCSGPVGAMQVSGPLKRMSRRFGILSGSLENRETAEKIERYFRTLDAVVKLKNLTIGLLPSPCNAMSGTHIEKDALKRQLGVTVQPITVKEYYDCFKKIPEREARKCAGKLRDYYSIEVSNNALLKNVRASMGLLRILDKYKLRALAYNDVDEELHKTFGLRPCLCIPNIFEKAVISMEGDVGAAVALYLLKELTGKVVMYTEIFTYDEKANLFLAGHAGMQDSRLAEPGKKIRIVPDHEYKESEKETAAMQFVAKTGTVTMLNIFFNGREFQVSVLKGKAVHCKSFNISPYICIRPDVPVNDFMEKIMGYGTTQHWAVVHKDVLKELKCLRNCGMNVTFVDI